MLALPRQISRMLNDVMDDDIFYWPISTLQNRNWLSTLNSDIHMPTCQDGKFAMNFDVRNFDPNSVQVKLDGNNLQVQAKQEKKADGHYEYREFVRHVTVPQNVQSDQLKCKMDKDGVLRFEAPLKQIKNEEPKERVIPIEMVNKNKPAVEQQKESIKK
ncbi:heat shock protein Hsp-16.48/Hsp-16.49-like [Dermatophagoides farinae]|uniref:heat shock protein Hsp-16.48/Hsp-16.49-like n=1 Tax=Dermatophagoides farinae TaxID=6954 RepID=UPI003F5FA140